MLFLKKKVKKILLDYYYDIKRLYYKIKGKSSVKFLKV